MDNLLLDYVVIALYFAVMIGAGYWAPLLYVGRWCWAPSEQRMRAWGNKLGGSGTPL